MDRAYYRVPRWLVHGGCLALLVGVVALVLGMSLWLRAAASFLIVDERLPRQADAIIVLGGGSTRGDRETQAAELYLRGLAPVVATTGGPVPGEEAPATYAAWSVERLVRRGVPPAAVLATNEGESTMTDARGVLRLAQERGWTSLLLVTDSWHTRRTELIFERVFAASEIDLYISPAPSRRFDPASWWLDENAALVVVTEYIKIGVFLFGIAG